MVIVVFLARTGDIAAAKAPVRSEDIGIAVINPPVAIEVGCGVEFALAALLLLICDYFIPILEKKSFSVHPSFTILAMSSGSHRIPA